MDAIADLFRFIRERRKWILMPVIMIMLILGVLIVFGGGSAIAPFIYTLF